MCATVGAPARNCVDAGHRVQSGLFDKIRSRRFIDGLRRIRQGLFGVGCVRQTRRRYFFMLKFVALILSGVTLAADASDAGSWQAPRPPFLAASYLGAPAADLAAAQPRATVNTTEAQLTAGLHRFGAGDLRIGFDYQYTRYEYAQINGRNRDLHRVQLPLSFTGQGGAWEIDGVVAPGVSTSSNVIKDPFNELSSDDLNARIRVEGRRKGPGVTWVTGLAYDAAFGNPQGYPLLGIELQPGDRLQARIAFPDTALSFAATDRHRFSVRLFPAGHQWHVVSDQLGDDFDYRIQAVRTQLSWSMRWRPGMTLDVSLGYEFGRHHLFIDDLGQRVDTDAADQVLFAIGFRVGRAPLPLAHGKHL